MHDFTAKAGVIDSLRGTPVFEGEILHVAITEKPPTADGHGHGALVRAVGGQPVAFDTFSMAREHWALRNREPIYFNIPVDGASEWHLVVLNANDEVVYSGRLYPASAGCVAKGRIRLNTEAVTLLRRRPT